MTDILDLTGWKAIKKRYEGPECIIEADYTIQPTSCPKCGVVDTPYKHGVKPIKYRDSPIRGETTFILANVQRYRCKHCKETFLQPLGGIYPDMRMTQRCVEYIQHRCLSDTFIKIAGDVGCDDKTARTLAGAYIADMNARYKPSLPDWLGIDETMIDGLQRCVLTDVVNRKPIDMLPDRDKDLVVSWLHRYKDKGVLKGLAMDMWPGYKSAMQIVFPGIPIVIDKFHVVKKANEGMEHLRRSLAKKKEKGVGTDWMRRSVLLRMRKKNLDEKGRFNLQMWLDNEPDVGVAYNLKESFFDIYDAPNKEAAALLLDEWRKSVPDSMKVGEKSFKPLLTAVKNWRKEILNYFDYPITNGYTEALNGVAKVANRQGRGYSFEVLRARLLFKKGLPAEDVRCPSCHGLFNVADFEARKLERHPDMLMAEFEWQEMPGVCRLCRLRFHTELLNHRDSTSTLYSAEPIFASRLLATRWHGTIRTDMTKPVAQSLWQPLPSARPSRLNRRHGFQIFLQSYDLPRQAISFACHSCKSSRTASE